MVGGNWFNTTEGLYLKFGTSKVVPATAGEYRTNASLREVEVVISLSTLTSSSAILEDNVFIPKNMFIEEVVLEVQTASTIASGTPTLDVGYMRSSDRTTVISNTAFINAEVDSGVLNTAGKKITYTAGVAKAGGLIGTTTDTAQVGQLSARANSGLWSAGTAIVRIRYRPAQ